MGGGVCIVIFMSNPPHLRWSWGSDKTNTYNGSDKNSLCYDLVVINLNRSDNMILNNYCDHYTIIPEQDN